MNPVLKWAGGKRDLAARIAALLPAEFEGYYEPFCGGGAVFFALEASRFQQALLSDMNKELVVFYRTVRDSPYELCSAVAALHPAHVTRERYEQVRAWQPQDSVARAARLLYLNKLGFNGLYRVRKSDGAFNAPWGKKESWKPDYDGLRAASFALARAHIYCCDFAECAAGAKRGDVVYLDPPYVPVSDTANFVGYTPDGFGVEDQIRVATMFESLAVRGVTVVASNADTPAIRGLYSAIEGATLIETDVRRRINCRGDRRGPVGELLIVANGAPHAPKTFKANQDALNALSEIGA